jgi:hypothetical protein
MVPHVNSFATIAPAMTSEKKGRTNKKPVVSDTYPSTFSSVPAPENIRFDMTAINILITASVIKRTLVLF